MMPLEATFSRLFRRRWLLCCLCCLCGWVGCQPDPVAPEAAPSLPPVPALPTWPYATVGSELWVEGAPTQLKGVNALNAFGPADHALRQAWGVEVVREFIGNLREQPLTGSARQASDGSWLHPLQTLVDLNRAQGHITLLCPFGWVDEQGRQTLFTGLYPRQQPFYAAYLRRMQELARHFRDQPDVWLQVWNEPYPWDNAGGYTHAQWRADMAEQVDNLRWVEGFENIIVVPGNEQGQGEAALLAQGARLLEGRYNLLFDLHAYGRWHDGATPASVRDRIEAVQAQGLAVIFGEVGVITEGAPLSDPSAFLAAADSLGVGVLAWAWLRRASYPNALLTEEGAPNTTNNGRWGERFRTFLQP